MASQKALQSWMLQSGVWVILIVLIGIPFLVNLIYSLSEFRFETLLSPTISGWDNYVRVIQDSEFRDALWFSFQFASVTTCAEVIVGAAIAIYLGPLLQRQQALMAILMLPMMLSPAVVGNFWTFLYQPQIGLFNYVIAFFTGADPSSFSMIGEVGLAPWAIVIVDTWMWTPFVMLICLAGLRSIPPSIYEAAECDRASKWRQFWTITIPMVLPFLMLAVLFRGIENFKMFDLVVQLTGGGPGATTQLVSIDLKREAFEKWRTGYASAYAVILFVTVFGLASIYVKALNKVKDR